MSRPLRIEYANAFYHVMNRGAGHKPIFKNDTEKELFLSLLSNAHTQFKIEIHSYCLMTTHYHLLIKTPLPNLSRAMRYINGVYTQRYNLINDTDGPLFRGRYKSILVDSDSYLLHLSKYIHLNPIEAKMVENLCQYKWSSYRAYIGECKAPKWLFKTEVYGQLNKLTNNTENYRVFMEDIGQNEQIDNFYSKERIGPVLGGNSFIQSLPQLNQSIEISRIDRLINRPTLQSIFENTANEFAENYNLFFPPKKGRGVKNDSRKVAMYIAHKKYDYQLTEIATELGLKHYGSVANAIYVISKKFETISELENRLNSIVKRLDPYNLDGLR